MDVLGEGKGANPIHDAEIYRLGVAAHQWRHHIQRHMEYLGRCDRMDILLFLKRPDHIGVPGNMGQHPQFNLGIIRVHQYAPVLRAEKPAQFPS